MSLTKVALAALLTLLGFAAISSARVQTYKVLYSFTGGTDGAFPEAGLIRDSGGILYGTTAGAGEGGSISGSIFKLTSSGRFTLLYNFGAGNPGPYAPLVRDSSKNLFGTIIEGGIGGRGPGLVFKLGPKNNYSVFYGFPDRTGTQNPFALTVDPAGNLYGAAGGGEQECNTRGEGCGVVFKLDPSGDESVLHTFSNGKKGSYPYGGLLLDASGNLYGTTEGSENPKSEIVFELDPAGNETVLYTFKWVPETGSYPNGDLIQDASGNFYGTTRFGGLKKGCPGNSPCGTIFKLDTNGNETTLYYSTGESDGAFPLAGLVQDASGNLYGTATDGGIYNLICGEGCGALFKLDPTGNLTVLHDFTGGTDGASPVGGLTIDLAGNLYGTAANGGDLNDCSGYGCGVVFEITP